MRRLLLIALLAALRRSCVQRAAYGLRLPHFAARFNRGGHPRSSSFIRSRSLDPFYADYLSSTGYPVGVAAAR